MAMRIILTDQTKHKTKKSDWLALYREVAEMTPNSMEFEADNRKMSRILEIIQGMKKSELNAFADELAAKVEYQRLYRDGKWHDSPEDYNTKTQEMIDHIFEDLMVYQIGRSIELGFKRARA